MYERVKDSADSMMMAIVFEVGEYTSFTVISCPLIKQTSTPSGSQPLSLRARHLPLPQGTAFIRCPRRERGIKFHERMRVRNSPLELLERVASTKHVSAAASRVSQKFVSDGQALHVLPLP